MTLLRSINIGDSPNLDAFDRLRVSEPTAFFDSKMTCGILGTRWIQDTASNGTVTAAHECAAILACTADSGSSAILQTKQRGIYQSGRSLLSILTFNLGVAGNGTANIRKRVGMFDENDGVYLEQNGTDVRLVLRTNTTATPSDANYVTKDNWNLDKMDGTGKSSITLDFTKPQILIMDLEWLGVGRVRVGFVYRGMIYYCHEFRNTNESILVPYMSNPNLPCRYECVQTASSGTGSLLAVCCTILSEGGFDDIGRLAAASTGVTGRSLGAVRDEVMSIRLGTTFIRKGMLQPVSISVLQPGNQAFFWELVRNPTLTGTVDQGTWIGETDSIAEYNITRTGTTAATGGNAVASGFVSTALDSFQSNLNAAIPVGMLDLTPTSDILSLLVTTANASDQTYYASLGWRELR